MHALLHKYTCRQWWLASICMLLTAVQAGDTGRAESVVLSGGRITGSSTEGYVQVYVRAGGPNSSPHPEGLYDVCTTPDGPAWDERNTQVVCRELGYKQGTALTPSSSSSSTTTTTTSSSSSTTFLVSLSVSGVRCQGDELALAECQLQYWRAQRSCNAVQVSCTGHLSRKAWWNPTRRLQVALAVVCSTLLLCLGFATWHVLWRRHQLEVQQQESCNQLKTAVKLATSSSMALTTQWSSSSGGGVGSSRAGSPSQGLSGAGHRAGSNTGMWSLPGISEYVVKDAPEEVNAAHIVVDCTALGASVAGAPAAQTKPAAAAAGGQDEGEQTGRTAATLQEVAAAILGPVHGAEVEADATAATAGHPRRLRTPPPAAAAAVGRHSAPGGLQRHTVSWPCLVMQDAPEAAAAAAGAGAATPLDGNQPRRHHSAVGRSSSSSQPTAPWPSRCDRSPITGSVMSTPGCYMSPRNMAATWAAVHAGPGAGPGALSFSRMLSRPVSARQVIRGVDEGDAPPCRYAPLQPMRCCSPAPSWGGAASSPRSSWGEQVPAAAPPTSPRHWEHTSSGHQREQQQ